jgi:hypothetical protein
VAAEHTALPVCHCHSFTLLQCNRKRVTTAFFLCRSGVPALRSLVLPYGYHQFSSRASPRPQQPHGGSRVSAARGPSPRAMPHGWARAICVTLARLGNRSAGRRGCRPRTCSAAAPKAAGRGRRGINHAVSSVAFSILMPPPHVHTYARLLECWINRFRDARGHRVRAIAIGCSPVGWSRTLLD